MDSVKKQLKVGDKSYDYYSLSALNDPRVDKLPISIRTLLECAVRNQDNFVFRKEDVEKILNWEKTSQEGIEIPFKPARVVLQDFTGVPAVVDLAAMRDAVKRLGGDPDIVNPVCPVDLVIDHSVQVDAFRVDDALEINQRMEFERNEERFQFLKWGSKAFRDFTIVPPGSGIVHQVNLEYLARCVMTRDNVLYPDTLVGTDSHTTMINGLGVVGWGVGGIEAEAAMLGQAISMVLPKVVGFKLTGKMPQTATATDLVLLITSMLRKQGVVGTFVEFYGPGVATLSLSDRATISNMCPEYGATIGFFPVDYETLDYMRLTGRSGEQVDVVEAYLKANKLFVDPAAPTPHFSVNMCLDLAQVVPSMSGPKRPHDYVPLNHMKSDFAKCLTNAVGFKGFGLTADDTAKSAKFSYQGKQYTLGHGSVVIAAITSCTNTSNPAVMLAAGLLARNAVRAGLTVAPYVKTSLSPGSGVVMKYLERAKLVEPLKALGFTLAGFGCMTCIGNSGPLPEEVEAAIKEQDLIVAGVLSGNRNFEGRIHQAVPANYLASPPLVVAYALAGTLNIDFDKDPIGTGKNGQKVFLRDLWPSADYIRGVSDSSLESDMFTSVYSTVTKGNDLWNSLNAPTDKLYPWSDKSTYIHNPPFFQTMKMEPASIPNIDRAYCLLNLGDSITTDHISPAGAIARNSPAARYLEQHGVDVKSFNTYGARRGNDEVMARGTFANIRLRNKFLKKAGPRTIHIPTQREMDVFDAAMAYKHSKDDIIILGGSDYGSGSSRDWAAKGPYLQGVRAVIAKSFERIHRSNLVGMGIVPLQFQQGEDAESLGLTGYENFTIALDGPLVPGMHISVFHGENKTFRTTLRFDTPIEIEYFKHGGILPYVVRGMVKKSTSSK